jgi:hypothetical protein
MTDFRRSAKPQVPEDGNQSSRRGYWDFLLEEPASDHGVYWDNEISRRRHVENERRMKKVWGS